MYRIRFITKKIAPIQLFDDEDNLALIPFKPYPRFPMTNLHSFNVNSKLECSNFFKLECCYRKLENNKKWKSPYSKNSSKTTVTDYLQTI